MHSIRSSARAEQRSGEAESNHYCDNHILFHRIASPISSRIYNKLIEGETHIWLLKQSSIWIDLCSSRRAVYTCSRRAFWSKASWNYVGYNRIISANIFGFGKAMWTAFDGHISRRREFVSLKSEMSEQCLPWWSPSIFRLSQNVSRKSFHLFHVEKAPVFLAQLYEQKVHVLS
jgi:hypothetical protein